MTPEQLISKWKHVLGVHPIPTWTEAASLAYCAEVASECKEMVEIGSFVGCSAKVMLAANPELHLWCVDIFTAFEFNFEVCQYFLKQEISDGRCELIKGDSDKASEMLAHMRGFLDAVWVDGCHASDCVKRDIHNFFPLLKPNGILFGHDFDIPHNDVAIGVLSTVPRHAISLPVPRVWSVIKLNNVEIF